MVSGWYFHPTRVTVCERLLRMTESTIPHYPRLVLAKGREKSLLRRHPWVFSGAVARMEGKANLGETVDIVDHRGNG